MCVLGQGGSFVAKYVTPLVLSIGLLAKQPSLSLQAELCVERGGK